jgi:hypothetical protein
VHDHEGLETVRLLCLPSDGFHNNLTALLRYWAIAVRPIVACPTLASSHDVPPFIAPWRSSLPAYV